MADNKNKQDTPLKEVKHVTPKQKESAKDVTIRVWRVIVASSIAYAIVVIVMGTDGIIPKIMLVPAGIYGAFLLIKR